MITVLFTMKHDKCKVFFPAVATMMGLHLMSVGLGNIFPLLFSKNAIVYFSVFLFLFFGCLMLWEAYHLQPKKAEEKLAELSQGILHENVPDVEATGSKTITSAGPSTALTTPEPHAKKLDIEKEEKDKQFCENPYLHLVVLLFLADWGDRCQISAIVLTATYNVWGVAAGGALVTKL
jgi:putative Ca2+/H+ antiporter (TMEM165/GDT1 family)